MDLEREVINGRGIKGWCLCRCSHLLWLWLVHRLWGLCLILRWWCPLLLLRLPCRWSNLLRWGRHGLLRLLLCAPLLRLLLVHRLLWLCHRLLLCRWSPLLLWLCHGLLVSRLLHRWCPLLLWLRDLGRGLRLIPRLLVVILLSTIPDHLSHVLWQDTIVQEVAELQ